MILLSGACARGTENTISSGDVSSITTDAGSSDASGEQVEADAGSAPPPSEDAGKDPTEDPVIEPPPEDCGKLKVIVRDFTPAHPDFENPGFGARNEAEALMAVTGLIQPELGPDDKPVFASIGMARPQITSAQSFASWYNDVEGTNMRVEVELSLTKDDSGVWVYDSGAFFPVDGLGFGNYQNFAAGLHNFHFTTEIHVSFRYTPGQKFTFRGDDDLWLFVGKRLAVDLGGLHLPVSGTVDMDALAAELGLEAGAEVAMDIFHAERHTEQSNFRIETNIECFVPPPPPL